MTIHRQKVPCASRRYRLPDFRYGRINPIDAECDRSTAGFRVQGADHVREFRKRPAYVCFRQYVRDAEWFDSERLMAELTLPLD